MKKVIKGKKAPVFEEVKTYFDNISEKDANKVLQVVISDVRTLAQNDRVHAILREIQDYIGELDFEQVKKDVKYALGYYKTEKTEVHGATYSITTYEETSSMSSKEIGIFMEKLEIWGLQQFGLNFKNLK